MTATQPFFQSHDFWAASMPAGASLLQALAIIIGAYLAYKFALRQMHLQTKIQAEEDLRQRQAKALQTAWSLLQSLTQVDNAHSIIRVVFHERGLGSTRTQSTHEAIAHMPQGSNDGTKPTERSYYINLSNAQCFVFERLPNAFYGSGAGLLWSAAVRDKFFEARNIIYGLLLAEGILPPPTPDTTRGAAPGHSPTTANARPLNNAEVANKLQCLYDELNSLLRTELRAVYAQGI